jgi:hypothetical protein
MAMRTRPFNQFPWTGGLNTSVDPSLLDPNELVQADNIIFTTQGTRRKREGINYNWDNLAVTTISRESDNTNRTLVTTGYSWKVGERITVEGLPDDYNTEEGVVTATDSTNKEDVTFTDATPGKVNWTAHGLAAGTAVAFRTTDTLPAELVVDKIYFVVNPDTNDFEVALAPGGAPLALSDTGTGTHTAREYLEDIITYTFTGAASLTEATEPDTDGVLTINEPVVALHDYWYDDGSAKSHVLMALTAQGRLFQVNLNSGARTPVLDIGTPYTALPLTRASLVTFDNRLMVATDGQNNVMKHFFPTTLGGTGVLEDVVNTPGFAPTPRASILQVHLGRLWCNDKDNFDRLHYCETGLYNVWQGVDDSGALDISAGDGDPDGITAIFPPFKGDLFIAKRTKLYRLQGWDPMTFQLSKTTDGLGCVGQPSVAAVDQDDIIFVSDRGVHSLRATDAFGDIQGAYLSDKIQRSVNESWNTALFKNLRSVYVPTLNSVAFTVAEGVAQAPNNLWFYNVPLKQWYRWPEVECVTAALVQDGDRQRLYLGTGTSRVGKTFSGFNYDIDTAGEDQAVVMTLQTGRIFPDGSPSSLKAFKQFALIYKPTGTYNISVEVKVDNFTPQPLAFTDSSGSDVLDINFVLGQSVLGGERVAQAYIQTVDGYGRGFSVTITQSGVNEFGEILGYQMYYLPAEWPQETRTGDAT